MSALDRTITTEAGALDGLIQTDAAISSGNSGGPLVDVGGRIVGINTAVARSDIVTAATNVGFAISSNEVEEVLEALRSSSGGEARREGFLGIQLEDRTDGGQGAVVTDVTADSPADEAGIESGDVVVAVDAAATDGRAGVIAAIRDHEPGDEVEVVVVRDGDEETFAVTLGERQDDYSITFCPSTSGSAPENFYRVRSEGQKRAVVPGQQAPLAFHPCAWGPWPSATARNTSQPMSVCARRS